MVAPPSGSSRSHRLTSMGVRTKNSCHASTDAWVTLSAISGSSVAVKLANATSASASSKDCTKTPTLPRSSVVSRISASTMSFTSSREARADARGGHVVLVQAGFEIVVLHPLAVAGEDRGLAVDDAGDRVRAVVADAEPVVGGPVVCHPAHHSERRVGRRADIRSLDLDHRPGTEVLASEPGRASRHRPRARRGGSCRPGCGRSRAVVVVRHRRVVAAEALELREPEGPGARRCRCRSPERWWSWSSAPSVRPSRPRTPRRATRPIAAIPAASSCDRRAGLTRAARSGRTEATSGRSPSTLAAGRRGPARCR